MESLLQPFATTLSTWLNATVKIPQSQRDCSYQPRVRRSAALRRTLGKMSPRCSPTLKAVAQNVGTNNCLLCCYFVFPSPIYHLRSSPFSFVGFPFLSYKLLRPLS